MLLNQSLLMNLTSVFHQWVSIPTVGSMQIELAKELGRSAEYAAYWGSPLDMFPSTDSNISRIVLSNNPKMLLLQLLTYPRYLLRYAATQGDSIVFKTIFKHLTLTLCCICLFGTSSLYAASF